MSLPRYAAYKPSGVEWLEQIPAAWEMKRLKYVANRSEVKVEAEEDNPLPYIGLEHVESWTGRLLPLDEELVPTGVSNSFKSGDTLLGKLRPYLAKACNVDFDGLCSSELLVLRGKSYEPRFLLYQLLSPDFINLVDSSTYGSKMPRANWDFIGSCELAYPPLEEQQSIARFLDAQTAKLDTLMTKKRALIDKLKEKRNALISRTVTRGLPVTPAKAGAAAAQAAGLEPHPAMKDSGVEWLGEIPTHWEVKPLKYLFKSVGGGTPSKANAAYWGGDIPWVSPKDMSTKKISDSEDHISADAVIESTVQMVAPGATLIVVRSGILRHTIPVATNLVEVTLNQDMKALVARGPILNEYLAYYIQGLNRPLLENWTKSGCTVESIESDYMLNSLLPVPPKNEQQAIAAYLDLETAHIDQLIAKVEAAIERLTEYRQALITAAVTGKIDVRTQLHKEDA